MFFFSWYLSIFIHLLHFLPLLICQESSSIHSNANLGVHGQGLLNLTGPGDVIEAQRLVLSLFYGIHVSDKFPQRDPSIPLGAFLKSHSF